MTLLRFARGQRARPLVYGHRGTRRGAPENTLLALRRALEQGADGVELDVRLCASGEVVVLHDPDLRRVGGAELAAAKASLRELQAVDLGEGERVPTLDAALELVLGQGALLNIELKEDVPDQRALVAAVVQRVAARSSDERARVLFSSFGRELCDALHALWPEAQIAWLFARTRTTAPPFAVAVHPQHALADATSIAEWHAQGLLVNAWTVNEPAQARELSRAAIDGIVTDDVPLVVSAL